MHAFCRVELVSNVNMAIPWQSQFGDLKGRLSHLLETKTMSDCSFLVGKAGQSVPAHRLVVGIASSVLQEKLQEAGEKPAVILDVEPDVFERMMKYIYTDTIDINTSDMAYQLCKAAQAYLLPSLEKECYKYIASDLTAQNLLQAYELAVCNKDDELTKKCEETIKLKTKEVLNSDEFVNACIDAVVAAFSLEPLDIDSEVDLLKALDRFAKNYKTRQSGSECDTLTIKNALEKIRFLTLTPEQFVTGRAGLTVLEEHDSCAILSNLVCNESDLPMPPNFSLRRDHRKKGFQPVSEVRFRYRINLENLGDTLWTSKHMLQDVPWKICMQLKAGSKKHYALYEYCNWEDYSSSWYCDAEIEYRILRIDMKPYSKKLTFHFVKDSSNRGYENFIDYDTVMDPANKYLHDGDMILEVIIRADELKRV